MDTPVVTSALLALLLYINTLPADFAYDDRLVTSLHFARSSALIGLFTFVGRGQAVAASELAFSEIAQN